MDGDVTTPMQALTTEDEHALYTHESFKVVRKNRNSCIHWLLRLAQRIESEWSNEEVRRERLEVLRLCLEDCREHGSRSP